MFLMGMVSGVAHFITAHEQTAIFISLVCALLSKYLTIENLTIFTADDVVPYGER